MIKPYRLKKGDKVAIVSLSRGLLGKNSVKHELDIALKRLKDYGLIPIIMPHALDSFEELLEHPEYRAQDLKDAYKDDSIKCIINAVGGFDTFRTYEYLMDDEEFLYNIKNNPKIFTGFSDTTMNHLMFYKLGVETFYGPAIVTDFAELDNEMLPYTKKYFEKFFESEDSYEITSSPLWYKGRKSYGEEQIGTSRPVYNEEHGFEVLNGNGIVEGKLWGGCIDTIYQAFTGKRFNGDFKYIVDIVEKYKIIPTIEEFKEMILFLEPSDYQPSPEEFKNYLIEFKKRKIIQNVKGIIFGKPQDEKYYDEYKVIFKEVFKDIQTPILYNVNFGHAVPRCIIPYGANATVDYDNKKIIINEKITI